MGRTRPKTFAVSIVTRNLASSFISSQTFNILLTSMVNSSVAAWANSEFSRADLAPFEIWERGAGYTLASGSSSSAAAAVAYRLGLCDRSIAVRMPGGEIMIEISDDFMVTMTGGVTKVAEGSFSLEIFDY